MLGASFPNLKKKYSFLYLHFHILYIFVELILVLKNHCMKNAIILIVAVFLLYACGQRQTAVSVVRSVKTDTVRIISKRPQVTFPGKVRASSDINLAFRVAGTILKVPVEEGAYVRKGQTLAEIDPRDYQIQLSATEAEYNRIKAEADRVIALYNKGSATPNDYDKAVYGLNQITAKYEAHRNMLADTRLRAPFDGFVQKKLFDSNETVSAGMPVLSMIHAGSPEVEINIPATDFVQREKFDSFSCSVDQYPKTDFPLDLLGITHKANLNQLYTVRLKLRDTGGNLPAAGMPAMVTIYFKSEEGGMLIIPLTALFSDNGKSAVWVYDSATGTVDSRMVTMQEILTNGTVIVSEGLEKGDLVVSAGVHSLHQGDKVAPLPPVVPTNIGGML
jgi:RND family efflux transporter MFP subunit